MNAFIKSINLTVLVDKGKKCFQNENEAAFGRRDWGVNEDPVPGQPSADQRSPASVCVEFKRTMAGDEQQQAHLIFFDTFSRETADVTAHDLIQFRSPVRIHEIRIIPLGARVAANFPNGDRLG